MVRKKRGNPKAQAPQHDDDSIAESSTRQVLSRRQDVQRMDTSLTRDVRGVDQNLVGLHPGHDSSAGFFQGTNGVEISGGKFNQTYGHQTNVTIHVNPGRSETPELPPPVQQQASTSTPQIVTPSPIHFSSNVPNIATTSYAPDNSNQIYERNLGVKGRGFPLWIPEPNRRLPVPYRRGGVNIGDVGIITPSGGFSFIFNICRPPNDPINPSTLPEGFTPIHPPLEPMDVCEILEFGADSYLASTAIEKVNNEPAFRGLSFQTSAADGAVLTMPEGAISLDLENIPRFRAYAATHMENWYRYINGPRGRQAKNGEVRLVTGCDKTPAWGTVAVANISQHKTHHLKFRAVEDSAELGSLRRYRWDYSGLGGTRVGPDLREIEELKRDDDSNVALGEQYWNQCIFIRTLNLTLDDATFESISRDVEVALVEQFRQFEKMANNAASSGTHSNAATNTERTSEQSDSNNGETRGGLTQSNWDELTVSAVRMQRGTISDTQSAPKFHPADGLNRELLSKAPHCRAAITHDEDWFSVFNESDSIMPDSEEIVSRVLAVHNVKEEDGIIYLEPKQEHLNNIQRRAYPNHTKRLNWDPERIQEGERVVAIQNDYRWEARANRRQYMNMNTPDIEQRRTSFENPNYLSDSRSEDENMVRKSSTSSALLFRMAGNDREGDEEWSSEEMSDARETKSRVTEGENKNVKYRPPPRVQPSSTEHMYINRKYPAPTNSHLPTVAASSTPLTKVIETPFSDGFSRVEWRETGKGKPLNEQLQQQQNAQVPVAQYIQNYGGAISKETWHRLEDIQIHQQTHDHDAYVTNEGDVGDWSKSSVMTASEEGLMSTAEEGNENIKKHIPKIELGQRQQPLVQPSGTQRTHPNRYLGSNNTREKQAAQLKSELIFSKPPTLLYKDKAQVEEWRNTVAAAESINRPSYRPMEVRKREVFLKWLRYTP